MKKILLTIVGLISTLMVHAQGANCASMEPVCTTNAYSIPASTNTSSEAGNAYGCLTTQPNPAWYYFEISNSGNIDMVLDGNGEDVDFIIWGPFNDLSAAQSNCGSMSAGQIVDCSYDATTVEYPSITNAQVGDVYVMLITNYSNNPTQIDFQQIGGAGATDCSIVSPCNISGLTAIPTACDPADNLYDLSGTITFANEPGTGTLTVTNSCGGSQTFNAPFTSPINYSITDIVSDGASCTVTATFSDDPFCTMTTNFNAPAECLPSCEITDVTATPSNCSAGNVYDVTGSVSFTTPPGSGTLTVSSSCGGSQVFNAPFSSPINYSLTGLNADGSTCTVTAEFSAESCSLTQDYTSPSVPVTNAGTDQEVCDGGSVTLAGSGAATYSWDNGVVDNVSFIPASTLTYTVTGTNAEGCSSTDQVVVTVNQLPNVSAGNDQTICDGAQATLAGSGASTYVWDGGVIDNTPFTPPSGTTTYTVTGTDANGCENTDQVDVTMIDPLVVNAGNDQSVCEGDEVTLSGSGASTYIWDNGVTDNTPFTPSVGSLTYTVIGTDVNGCQGTDDVVVTVNAAPVVSAGVDQTICSGSQATLAGSGASTYTWDNGVTDNTPFTPSSAPTTYTVTGTDVNGCEGTDQVTVSWYPEPSIFGDTIGCDFGVIVNDTYSYNGGEWSSPDTAIHFTPNNTVDNPEIWTYAQSGVYTVTYTDNICGASVTSEIDFYEYPSTWLVDTTFCEGVEYNLIAPDYNTHATNYEWNTGTTGPAITITSAGTYVVTLNNLCHTNVDTINIYYQLCDIEAPNILSLAEGSQNSLWYVKVEGLSEFSIFITNRWGNVVYECSDNGANCYWDGRTQSGSFVQAGTYFYTIEAKNQNGNPITKHGFITVVD